MNDPPPPAGTAAAAAPKAAYCHSTRADAIRLPLASAPLLYSTSSRLMTSIQLSNSAAGADQRRMEIIFNACCRSL